MSETVPNESEWAEYSAARLKAVWVDFAEAPPPQRAQFLKEELSRAIKPIPGGYRKSYLERLRTKFPALASVTAAVPSPAPPEPAANMTAVETAPYEDLVRALLQRIEPMTLDEKTALAKQLKQLESSLPFPKPPPVAESSANPKDREALEAALHHFMMLENLAWRIWRDIAPQSTVRKEGDLRAEVSEYLRGKDEILPQIKETMGRNRMLIGGLLAAISGGPSKFASDFYDTFSPDNIMAVVGSNGNKCWLKYVELARQDFPIAPALNFKIRKKLAEFAENAMKQA